MLRRLVILIVLACSADASAAPKILDIAKAPRLKVANASDDASMRAWQHRFRALAARFQREYAHQRKVVTRGTVDARTGKFSLRVMTQDVHSRKLTTFTVGGGMPANWGEPDATRALSDVASRAE